MCACEHTSIRQADKHFLLVRQIFTPLLLVHLAAPAVLIKASSTEMSSLIEEAHRKERMATLLGDQLIQHCSAFDQSGQWPSLDCCCQLPYFCATSAAISVMGKALATNTAQILLFKPLCRALSPHLNR